MTGLGPVLHVFIPHLANSTWLPFSSEPFSVMAKTPVQNLLRDGAGGRNYIYLQRVFQQKGKTRNVLRETP